VSSPAADNRIFREQSGRCEIYALLIWTVPIIRGAPPNPGSVYHSRNSCTAPIGFSFVCVRRCSGRASMHISRHLRREAALHSRLSSRPHPFRVDDRSLTSFFVLRRARRPIRIGGTCSVKRVLRRRKDLYGLYKYCPRIQLSKKTGRDEKTERQE